MGHVERRAPHILEAATTPMRRGFNTPSCMEAADRYKGMSLIVRQKVRTSCRVKVPTFRRADADLRPKNEATLRAYSMQEQTSPHGGKASAVAGDCRNAGPGHGALRPGLAPMEVTPMVGSCLENSGRSNGSGFDSCDFRGLGPVANAPDKPMLIGLDPNAAQPSWDRLPGWHGVLEDMRMVSSLFAKEVRLDGLAGSIPASSADRTHAGQQSKNAA